MRTSYLVFKYIGGTNTVEVRYIAITSASLENYPVLNGQILAVMDKLAWYYDMNNQRYMVSSSSSAYSDTEGDSAAKHATCAQYVARTNTFVYVTLHHDNTAVGQLTLDINKTGAKVIYINGQISSSTNYTLPEGTYFVYYDGSKYYFRTDGKITASITGDAATVNGKTIAKSVPSDAKFTDTWTPMTGATYDADGSVGYVNAVPPKDGYNSKFLRADGVWSVPPGTSGNDQVTQVPTTTSQDYEVLFSASPDNTERTEISRKNSNLKFNPSTGNLQTTQLNGVNIGNSPKFSDTTYTVGTGLKMSNNQISTDVPRVTQDVNSGYVQNASVIKEYNSNSSHLPESQWYFVQSLQGSDTGFGAQLALGMTTEKVQYRIKNGNWNQLAFKNEIPTKLSQLTNDAGFITSSSVPTRVSQLSNDAGYITSSSIPTRVSQLSNDAGYITSSSVPTKVSQLTNDSGYITSSDTCMYTNFIKCVRQQDYGSYNDYNMINVGTSTMNMREMGPTADNRPADAWFFAMTMKSKDATYGTQLAIGMTVPDIYIRRDDPAFGGWSAWTKLH